MSTRSAIIVKYSDSKFTGIYCHSDGYPSYNGKLLLEHYTDLKKIEELLALGDISSLAPEIGEKHDFDACDAETVRAYGRDRGETGIEAKTSKSLKALRNKIDHEYAYVYDVETGKWSVYGHGMAGQDLTLVVAREVAV